MEGVGLVTARTRDLYQKPWRLGIFEGNTQSLPLNWKSLDHHYYIGIPIGQELSGRCSLLGDPAHPLDSIDHPEKWAQSQSKVKGHSGPPILKGQTSARADYPRNDAPFGH